MLHLADAKEREGEMRERREIARSADRPLCRDARIEPPVIELEQPLHQQRPHTRVAARQALDLERERETHRRVVEQRPGARGMRQHDVPLQLLELTVGDARLREAAKARVDAVGWFARSEDALYGSLACF